MEATGFELHFIAVSSSVVLTAADIELRFFFGWLVLKNNIQIDAWFVLQIVRNN